MISRARGAAGTPDFLLLVKKWRELISKKMVFEMSRLVSRASRQKSQKSQKSHGFGFSIGVKVSGKRPYRCVGRSKWVGLETCFMETQKLHHMTLNFDQGFENRKISAAFQEAPHDRL